MRPSLARVARSSQSQSAPLERLRLPRWHRLGWNHGLLLAKAASRHLGAPLVLSWGLLVTVVARSLTHQRTRDRRSGRSCSRDNKASSECSVTCDPKPVR